MNNSEKEPKDKRIDETWKEEVGKEKSYPAEGVPGKEEHKHAEEEHIADFNLFISSLAMQAFVYLGLMPDPMTQKTQADLVHAKYIIDTLEMLKEKTKNNLTTEENANLEEVLYTLKMKFIELSKA